MIFQIIALSLVFSGVLCQKPVYLNNFINIFIIFLFNILFFRPCTTPPQWEARLFEYDTVQKDMVRAHITYDSVYKRERVIEEFRLGQEDDYFDIIRLFNQKIEYVFNLKARNCTKRAITRDWVITNPIYILI
jgi:hypothetical protein